MAQDPRAAARGRFDRWFEAEVVDPMADFQNPRQEWRRLAPELFGTFFLVLVAAGGGMMSQAFPETISRQAAVVAPGLMVMGIILFMGKVSGAHLNPAVTLAFSLRGDFPWRRVPGYILVQLSGRRSPRGSCTPSSTSRPRTGRTIRPTGYSSFQAFWMEVVLTLGLVSVILGTASGAQNIGIIGAIGVGSYIALAGLWGSPISGTSMNPARTFGPDLVGARLHRLLGVRRRPARRRPPRGRVRLRAPRLRRRPQRLRGRPGRPQDRGRSPRPGLTRSTILRIRRAIKPGVLRTPLVHGPDLV